MIQVVENYVTKGFVNSLVAAYDYFKEKAGRPPTDEEKLAIQRCQEIFINGVQHQFILDAEYP